MNDLRLELKVCEGCGALWLRAGCPGAASAQQAPRANNVYCKSCVRMLAAFPAARGPKKVSRVRIRTRKPLVALSVTASALVQHGGAR